MKKLTFFSRKLIAGKYPLFLLKMKLLFLLLVLNLQVSAAAFSQVKVSVELKKTTLGNAIKVLEQKTGYRFVYNNEVVPVNKIINLSVSNADITRVMELLLDKLPLTYKMVDEKMIVIVEKQDYLFTPEAGQKVTVTGKVVDEQDQPLSGVTVVETGAGGGAKTVTDAGGKFSLEVSAPGATLSFSYVGFISKAVAAERGQDMVVKLAPENNKLNEVVVVGYGSQRSTSVTGSVAKVDAGDIAKLSTTSVDQQLAGRAAGVQVTVNSGSTNDAPRIRIRGINSINNGSSPLIVIDGVPVNTGDLGGFTATNPLADINPNDIVSFDVLKDGAASAIYGSRAANGVILITTRHGARGNTKVNYDAYMGIANPVKKNKLLNATQFVEITNEKYANNNESSPAVMDASNTNTDWQSLVYNKNAFSHSHNVGVSGANEKTNFFFSANYLDQQGAIQRNTTSRYGVRANVDHQVNRFIKIGTNTSITRLKNVGVNNSSGLSSVVINSLIALPNVSPYDAAGVAGYNVSGDGKSLGAGANLITIDDAYPNVLFSLNNDQYNIEKYRILSNAYVELSLLPGLKFRSQGNVDLEQAADFYSLDARHGDGYSYNGLVKNTSFSRTVYNLQNYFTYNQRYGKHGVTVTAGNEIQKNVAKSSMAGGQGFSSYFFQTKNLITGSYTTQLSGGTYAEGSFLSYFGRVNYDYAGKYLLAFTIRRDGLSALSQANRFGVFPGVSAGWRISDESFWKNNNIDNVASSLKLRASYGKVGNALSGFPYLSTYGAATYGSENGLALTNLGNSSLSWETSKKLDVGFDAGFLHNRITVGFDWFKNDVDNLVMNVTYPNSFGIPDNTVARNIGAMQNNGFEVSVTADAIKKKDFNWNISANFTRVKNKVNTLYNGQSITSTSYVIKEGLPLYAMIGYRYAGVNKANGNPLYYKGDGRLIQGDIASQKYYYANSKEDVTLTDVTTLTDADKVVLGNPTPTWYGGLNNTFTYKNFSLETFIRFSGGNSIDNSQRRTLLNQKFKNNGVEILDRWTPTHTDTDVPKLWYGKESFINLSPSSRWVEKGDYVRLQNVTFAYALSKETLTRFARGYVSSLRVYVQGQNLFTKTSFKGLDPDLISETGTSGNSIPVIRSFSVGVNVGF
ncbi:TonB-linked outer membrane protein, SusC/RagA family [Filimonas lacunae]|uniref:TonB-linked outer membrane protein, SusC/RagA family n=1 Tax=Filimonas lacunae TaxID=477680 RepID=A0A173MK82_9BACT|nr:TonB-dependent receptor [Filimonas lacunae]BAV07811.1 outer membrane protein, nutrient binding [Filimonas lacunae]SIT05092.1 TonB-linked outer membrane protein, SusC/RagA family [Filimonas lacunae]